MSNQAPCVQIITSPPIPVLSPIVTSSEGFIIVLSNIPTFFPIVTFDLGPVHIGRNVWLPARSIVLPNVCIGDNVVIGINSIINRDLPDGCFAAGSPCKVIKENVYPKKIPIEYS